MSNEQTLYARIENHFAELIQNRTLKPDDRLPSEKDISAEFAVSRITVRKALAGLEERGLIYRTPGRGTFVAPSAAQAEPNNADPGVIGVIMCFMDTPFQVALMRSIEQCLSSGGYRMLFGISNNDAEKESRLVEQMLAHGVRGLIIFPMDGVYYSEWLLKLSIEEYPIVLVDRFLPGIKACSVFFDNAGGGRLIGEYLLEKGHRNIAILSPDPKNTSSLTARIDGFNTALLTAGVAQRPEYSLYDLGGCTIMTDRDDYEACAVRIRRFVEHLPELTALYCTKSNIAMCAYKALHGFERAIEIACYDPVEDYEWTEEYPIAHIHNSPEEMGRAAVGGLEKLLRGEESGNVVLPVYIEAPGLNGPG